MAEDPSIDSETLDALIDLLGTDDTEQSLPLALEDTGLVDEGGHSAFSKSGTTGGRINKELAAHEDSPNASVSEKAYLGQTAPNLEERSSLINLSSAPDPYSSSPQHGLLSLSIDGCDASQVPLEEPSPENTAVPQKTPPALHATLKPPVQTTEHSNDSEERGDFTQALSIARAQVDELRIRCQELRMLVMKTMGSVVEQPVDSVLPEENAPQGLDPLSATKAEIVALRQRCKDLRLALETGRIGAMDPILTSDVRHAEHDVDHFKRTTETPLPRPSSPQLLSSSATREPIYHTSLSNEEVTRAVDFVSAVDELVWRRSTTSSSRANAAVFSPENIEALLSRVSLWERVVRGRR